MLLTLGTYVRHSEAVIFCRRVAPRLVETSENERIRSSNDGESQSDSATFAKKITASPRRTPRFYRGYCESRRDSPT